MTTNMKSNESATQEGQQQQAGSQRRDACGSEGTPTVSEGGSSPRPAPVVEGQEKQVEDELTALSGGGESRPVKPETGNVLDVSGSCKRPTSQSESNASPAQILNDSQLDEIAMAVQKWLWDNYPPEKTLRQTLRDIIEPLLQPTPSTPPQAGHNPKPSERECPECEGMNLSEIGRCGTCGATALSTRTEAGGEDWHIIKDGIGMARIETKSFDLVTGWCAPIAWSLLDEVVQNHNNSLRSLREQVEKLTRVLESTRHWIADECRIPAGILLDEIEAALSPSPQTNDDKAYRALMDGETHL